MYPASVKSKAIELRKQGFSIKEIQRVLGIARGTSSVWLKNTDVSDDGKKRLETKIEANKIRLQTFNKERGRQTVLKKAAWKRLMRLSSTKLVGSIEFTKNVEKLLCAMLFWAEGGKNFSFVQFSNSDPKMVNLFLELLKRNFNIDNNKIQVTLHVHEYHNDKALKQLWSERTHVPLRQFRNSYIKPHTGIRKKPGYLGCVDVRYPDYKVAQELESLYNAYAKLFYD